MRYKDTEIRGVLLDYDGVLMDSMNHNYLAWQKTMDRYEVALDKSSYLKMEGMKSKEVAARLLDLPRDGQEAIDVARLKDLNFSELESPRLYPDTLRLLQSLKRYPLGLVTGASMFRLERSPDFHGLKVYFQAFVTADEAHAGKPSPDPFLLGAKNLNLPPQEILVIENAPLGVRSAKAAGCTCFALETTLSATELSEADEVFVDHKSLLVYLAGCHL